MDETLLSNMPCNERELVGLDIPQQVHCVDPVSGETLQVATGLPILLTNLAVLPRLAVPSRRRGAGPSAGETPMTQADNARVHSAQSESDTAPAAGRASSDGRVCDQTEDVVVAVGGVGGRVTLVGLEVGNTR